jgi:hypothetical protein
VAVRHEQRIPRVSIILVWRILQAVVAGSAAGPIRSVDEGLRLTCTEAIELRENLRLTTVLDTILSSAVLTEG